MSDFIPLSPVTDYRLTMSDGTVIECTTSLQDTLAFEGQKKRSLTAAVGQVPLTSDLIWLAWHAACRENKTELRQFARFSAQLVKIEANRAVNPIMSSTLMTRSTVARRSRKWLAQTLPPWISSKADQHVGARDRSSAI